MGNVNYILVEQVLHKLFHVKNITRIYVDT